VAAVGAAVPVAVSPSPSTLTVSDEDGLNGRKAQQQTPWLSNSEMLLNLPSLMPHLSKEQEADMVGLIHNFPCLFGDVPTQQSQISSIFSQQLCSMRTGLEVSG